MNSIFLRIYGGLLLSLVLVGVLGVATVHVTNQVRNDEYRENLARGTFRLMSDNLLPMSEVERRRALVVWSRLLGVSLSLRPLADLKLDSGQIAGLRSGQVLVEQTGPHAAQVFSMLSRDEPLLLTTEVEQVSEQLARATLYLLIDELQRLEPGEQPGRLARIHRDKQFGFDLRLVKLDEADLDDDQRRRVEEGDTVMALTKGGDGIRLVSGLLDSPWVLVMGPIYRMDDYPPELQALIALMGLGLVGLIIYLLVRNLEHRLLALSDVATLIASGKLGARVPVRGSDAVGRLATVFNEMAEQLQRLLNIQREMVRAVSHELRTPVARLRFGLEMIGDAENDKARRRYMDGMDGDIQELDKLVDEMLTYARLEQGAPALNYQDVDLTSLLDKVAGELAPLRVGVHIERGPCQRAEGSGDSCVLAEPRYLQRAVQNLVSNALRHAEAQVRLSFSIGPEQCRIDVEDDGPGVPEAEWERVFTPFLRLDDSRTRASGGHGLGLSIVRRIIYWHHGRAQVDRSPALGGARFSLIWPRQQPADD